MTGLRAMEADKEHSDNFPVSVGRGPGPDDDQYSVSSGSDTGNVSPGSVMNCEWLAGDNSFAGHSVAPAAFDEAPSPGLRRRIQTW